ncbi:hypothetical protein L3i22_013000 [Actinoplanes sp. L3-i22]|nr:hypothetical protein L3i22_013000 [Actinoplanes sp. L3-i22]
MGWARAGTAVAAAVGTGWAWVEGAVAGVRVGWSYGDQVFQLFVAGVADAVDLA